MEIDVSRDRQEGKEKRERMDRWMDLTGSLGW